jgi:hypothetical protein
MKRSVTQRAIRIYGSQSWWGPDSRWMPPGSPFVSPDLPASGDQLAVHLGAVPDEVALQLRDRDALADAILDRTVDGAPVTLTEAAAARRLRAAPSFDGEEWYVTITLDHQGELEDAAEPISEEFWWDQSEAVALNARFREDATLAIDSAAVVVATSIGGEYLETLVTERDVTLLLTEHRPVSFVPVLRGSARASVGRSEESFPDHALGACLGRLSSAPAADLRAPLAHYVSALRDRDRWRSFQSRCMALEVLARKVGSARRTEVLGRLDELDDCADAVALLLWDGSQDQRNPAGGGLRRPRHRHVARVG